MSPKPKASARLAAARRAASKDLGLPLDHWAVRRTAILNLAHQNLEAALCDGHRIDIGDLLKIETALNEVKASLPPPKIAVELKLVGPDGSKSDLWADKPAAQIEGKAVETKPADKPIDTKPEVEASTPAPAPVPPLPAPRLDPSVASASDFHNLIVGNERAPLKRLQNVALQNNGITRSRASENWGNGGSVAWSGYDGRRANGTAQPDPNPSFHSDGTVRKPYEPSR